MKFKVEKTETYENCVKITISAKINGQTVRERFGVSKGFAKDGTWKQIVRDWLKKKEEAIGETIEIETAEYDTEDEGYKKKTKEEKEDQ